MERKNVFRKGLGFKVSFVVTETQWLPTYMYETNCSSKAVLS
jgi:hypothetical protein